MRKTKNNPVKRLRRHGAQKQKDSTRGFTLLLAVLAASIALVLGTSIFQIAVKQVKLSSISRDSEYAFYAADTAAECALYWNNVWSYYDIPEPSTPPANSPVCDTQSVIPSSGSRGTLPYTLRFQFEPNGRCAQVAVTKDWSVVGNATTTLIRADGYNVPCSDITGDTAIQRSVELNQ